jgi:hypothetical protein
MSFLSRFFGRRISQDVNARTANNHAFTSAAERPLWDIGLKILTATTKCCEKVLPNISLKDPNTQRESEGAIILEFTFFFLYFVLRTTSKNR